MLFVHFFAGNSLEAGLISHRPLTCHSGEVFRDLATVGGEQGEAFVRDPAIAPGRKLRFAMRRRRTVRFDAVECDRIGQWLHSDADDDDVAVSGDDDGDGALRPTTRRLSSDEINATRATRRAERRKRSYLDLTDEMLPRSALISCCSRIGAHAIRVCWTVADAAQASTLPQRGNYFEANFNA